MSRILLKNGSIIDPQKEEMVNGDILIDQDKIIEIGKNIQDKRSEVIDLAGKVVAPGLIDVHAHLRDPGYTYKEDMISASRAAAAGGFTTILAMPNTNPVCDKPMLIEAFLTKAKKEEVKVHAYPYCSVTKEEKGKTLSPMVSAAEVGAVAFSDDGCPIDNADLMRMALQYSQITGKVIACHEEMMELTGQGLMREGDVSLRLGLEGIPYTSESLMVARDIMLAEEVGGKLHLCHLSSEKSVALLQKAKEEGIDVTGEVVIHHLNTTEADIAKNPYDTAFKIKPPFGTKKDREALIKGVLDGVIEIIATDHAPHSEEEKSFSFDGAAPFGSIGLETALGVVLTELYYKRKMSLPKLIKTMTLNPALRFGLNGGRMKVGSPADLVVIDLEKEWQAQPDHYYSKARNCAQKDKEFKGKAVMTILSGKVVMKDGVVL